MKINTKVIFQWDGQKYVEVYSEHYEHKGSVALCGGGSPKAPKPTEQEVELQKLQLEDLKEARATQKALEPYILQSLGMKRDETGAFTKMTEEERLASMSDLEKQQYRITGLELERQEKALKGELPLSKATEEAYTQERQAFESEMSKRLGPQWKISTPGIQAEKAFESKWGLLKEGERFGQMERGTGAIATQYGLLSGIQGQKTAGYATPVQYGTGLLGGYSAAMQPYQQQRILQYDAAQKAAERKAGLLSDVGQLAGTVAAAKIQFSCFNGNTLVITDNGDKPIKDIHVGDNVLTNNGFTVVNGKFEYKGKSDLSINGVMTTKHHPFVLNDGTLIKAGDLNEGDLLYDNVLVKSKEHGDYADVVYNLQTENHKFTIAPNILVHDGREVI